jgi:RNA polymerase sigma factor (sigma-70 family)
MANRTSFPGLVRRVLSDSLSRLSDRQLLDRFAGVHDEAAFAAILDRHGPMILGVCRRLLSDAHLADDVLQATFLVLARKAGSIRRRESLASWLYGVAKRLARQARLAESARARREARVAGNRREAAERDPGWDELLRVLDDELQRLPEKQRSPLILCYLEGRTQDEAARQLGLTLSTCHRRLERGRQMLRTRMVQRGATLGGGLCALFLAPTAVRATLTFELRRAALTTALAGVKGMAIPASIALLAKGGMHMATGVKLLLWTFLAVAISGGLVGAFSRDEANIEGRGPVFGSRPAPPFVVPPSGGTGEQEPLVADASRLKAVLRTALVPAPAKEPRPDRAGEPLPKGATARLGTVAFRHGRNQEGSLIFTADGKSLISTGGGWIRQWDLATGTAVVNLGDGWRAAGSNGTTHTTADCKLARISTDVDLPGGGRAWECTEHEFASGRERTYHIEFPRGTNDAHRSPPYLSPDGKTYAELNHRGSLTLWNAVDGTFTHHLKAQGGAYTALAFPPDGKTIVVGDDTHTFRVFDLATARELRSFGILDGNVVAQMAVSPDGKWLVTAGGKKGGNPPIGPHDCFFRLWNLNEGTVVRTLKFPEDNGARSLLFTPDSGTVIAGIYGTRGSPAAVRSWHVASGKPGRAWTDDSNIGLDLAVSPNKKVLATMNETGVIRLWDFATGQERRLLEASPCSVEAVRFEAGGRTVVTVGEDGAVRTWEAASGRLLSLPRSLEKKGFGPRFSGGNVLVSYFWKTDDTTMVRLHDVATGKLIEEWVGFFGVASPDGKRLAFADKNRRNIRILDMGTRKEIQKLATAPRENKQSRHYDPFPQAFTPDGQSLVVQGEDVSVWDLRTGKQTSSWSLIQNKVLVIPAGNERHSWERIEAVAVSPDGNKIAISLLKDRPTKNNNVDWFGRLMVFETATGKVLHQADLEREAMERLAFSPNGQLLAGGSLWMVRVWELGQWNAALKFEGHRGYVKSLAFSPDSRSLASASADSTVLIWDVTKRRD